MSASLRVRRIVAPLERSLLDAESFVISEIARSTPLVRTFSFTDLVGIAHLLIHSLNFGVVSVDINYQLPKVIETKSVYIIRPYATDMGKVKEVGLPLFCYITVDKTLFF